MDSRIERIKETIAWKKGLLKGEVQADQRAVTDNDIDFLLSEIDTLTKRVGELEAALRKVQRWVDSDAEEFINEAIKQSQSAGKEG